MLTLTENAGAHLKRIRQERGINEDAGARFVRRNDRVRLTFAISPTTGDEVVETGGLRVYVAGDLADALRGSVVDVRSRQGKEFLVVTQRQPRTANAEEHPGN